MSSWLARVEGQTMPEYAVVLGILASSSAFLVAELGTRIAVAVTAVAGLLP